MKITEIGKEETNFRNRKIAVEYVRKNLSFVGVLPLFVFVNKLGDRILGQETGSLRLPGLHPNFAWGTRRQHGLQPESACRLQNGAQMRLDGPIPDVPMVTQQKLRGSLLSESASPGVRISGDKGAGGGKQSGMLCGCEGLLRGFGTVLGTGV